MALTILYAVIYFFFTHQHILQESRDSFLERAIMSQQEIILEVKRRLIERNIIEPCSFEDLHEEQNNVKKWFNELFPETGTALFSHWIGVYKDPMMGLYEAPTADQFLRDTYHNRAHVLTALDRLFKLPTHIFKAFSQRDQQILALALLLHDVDHTCGVNDDTMNIARSLRVLTTQSMGLRFYYPALMEAGVDLGNFMSDMNLSSTNEFEHVMTTCRTLILDTEFPYNRTPSTLGKVLRDIDRLTLLSRDYFEEVYEGLFSEISVRFGGSFLTFCRGQILFMKSFVWYNDEIKEAYVNSADMLAAEALTYAIWSVAREVSGEKADLY